LAFVVIAWGVLALTARLSTPLLEYAHDPIADWLSERLGQPVRFERIQASWWGIGPRLRLTQVEIGSGDQPVTLDAVSLDLSHYSLLKGQLLDALRLTLDGLQLNLVREADRRIHLVGLPTAAADSGGLNGQKSGRQLVLPRHTRLRHTLLRWEDRVRQAQPILVENIELDLVRRGEELDLRARLKSKLGNVRFAARISGFLGTDDWHGSSYLRVQGLQLRQLLSAYLPDHYQLHDGRLRGEIWQEWEQATEVSTLGSFRIDRLNLSLEDEQPKHFQLETLSGEIDYLRRSEGEWRVLLDQLLLKTLPEEPPEISALAIHRYVENAQRHFKVGANGLPLKTLGELAQMLPLDPQLTSALGGLQPTGKLRDLRLSLATGNEPEWAIDTKVESLSLQPWQSAPGIDALDLHLSGSSRYANLSLEGSDLRIDKQPLFPSSHTLTRLQGSIHWQPADDGWMLFSNDLALATADLDSKLWFEYRHTVEQAPSLHLRAQAREMDVAATSHYLPKPIMSPELVTWLDHSLSSGRLEQVDLLVSGPLQDFPFHRSRNGTFEVVGITRDTPLEYKEGWPPLRDVSAKLFFHENSLDIELLEGRIYDSEIVSAHARIDSLGPTSPLRLKGRLQGPLRDQLRVLQEPALEQDFGHVARALTTVGSSVLDLDFQVPLVHGRGSYELDGRLRFQGNRLSLKGWDLTVDRIQGGLEIGLEALRASDIRGRAFGSPILLDVRPNGSTTRIHTRANWPVATLQQRFPKLPLQLASGAADFTLDLDIPGAKAPEQTPIFVAVTSHLKGIALELPTPLGKTANEARLLEIEVPIGKQTGPVRVRYDGQLDAIVNGDASRGEIRVNRGRSQLPGQPGLRVLAELPRVVPAEWHRLVNRLPKGKGQMPWDLELITPMLALDPVELPDVRLDARGRKGDIDVQIDSRQFAGHVRYRAGPQGVLSADIERLYLSLPQGDRPAGPASDPAQGPDPRTLPRVELQCRDLRLNDVPMGELALSMQPVSGGSRIKRLALKGPTGNLQTTGRWTWQNNMAHTHLDGRLRTQDLGELLHALGLPRHVDGARSNLDFDLDWPGNPAQPQRASLRGSAELEVADGRLSEVEPGITRVLGLLSLDALKRRLKLDFGDLLKEGYSFDRISGHFEFGEGQARTRDLMIDGPSGRIEIGGRIGLVERDFDQVVQVAPKLDATLIIASTIAGGPIAGAATFLAQRLLSEEVDRINRFEYAVTGSWNEPQLTALKSGGPISQILHGLSGQQTEVKTDAQEAAIDESRTRPKKGLLEKLFGQRSEPTVPDESGETGFPGGD